MIKVTLVKVHTRTKKMLNENISFTCDSYQEYEEFYKFNFGYGMWSQNFDKRDIKSIEQV